MSGRINLSRFAASATLVAWLACAVAASAQQPFPGQQPVFAQQPFPGQQPVFAQQPFPGQQTYPSPQVFPGQVPAAGQPSYPMMVPPVTQYPYSVSQPYPGRQAMLNTYGQQQYPGQMPPYPLPYSGPVQFPGQPMTRDQQPASEPAQPMPPQDLKTLNNFYYYPYYYYPHNYWPTVGPQWPEPTGSPYQPPPAYMSYPPFLEPNWRYEMWEPQKYYRGFHFWLDQF